MLSLLGSCTVSLVSQYVKTALKQSVLLHYNNQSLKIMSSNSTSSSTFGDESGHTSTKTITCSESSPDYSKAGLRKELMPKHIAIILDGNRRWLRAQEKPLDYEPFFQANALFADLCLKWGVTSATSFIYSLENLQRGKEANELIFGQLEKFLRDNMANFIRKQVCVLMMGERRELPKSLQDMIKQVEDATRREKTKSQLEFRLAICYTGTRDIVEAARSLCEKAKGGVIEPGTIDEALFDRELLTRGTPPPDLLIRVGGEIRLSNYMLWQLAKTEFYFNPIYAPEFAEDHFLEALRSYQQRGSD